MFTNGSAACEAEIVSQENDSTWRTINSDFPNNLTALNQTAQGIINKEITDNQTGGLDANNIDTAIDNQHRLIEIAKLSKELSSSDIEIENAC